MSWNASVTLIKDITDYINDVDEKKRESKKKGVPAKIKSVKGAEFYAAKSAGIKTDLIVEIMAANYDGEQYLIDEHTKIKYELVRSYYIRNGERVELSVSVVPVKRGKAR